MHRKFFGELRSLLVAIITSEAGSSSWIQSELGMAYALKKPILVFYESGVTVDGFAPMVTEYVNFDRTNLAALINEKDRLVKGIRTAVAEGRRREDELMAFSEQKNLGVMGVYSDRKEAFLNFREHWDSEKDLINIVALTLEGLRRFVGDPGHELLETKLKNGCKFQVLLTHPEHLRHRAKTRTRPFHPSKAN